MDGIPGVAPREFAFFDDIAGNTAIRKAYETMQNQYVLRASDRISYDTVIDVIKQIQQRLRSCPEWMESRIPMKAQLTIAQCEADKHNAERKQAVKRDKSVPNL